MDKVTRACERWTLPRPRGRWGRPTAPPHSAVAAVCRGGRGASTASRRVPATGARGWWVPPRGKPMGGVIPAPAKKVFPPFPAGSVGPRCFAFCFYFSNPGRAYMPPPPRDQLVRVHAFVYPMGGSKRGGQPPGFSRQQQRSGGIHARGRGPTGNLEGIVVNDTPMSRPPSSPRRGRRQRTWVRRRMAERRMAGRRMAGGRGGSTAGGRTAGGWPAPSPAARATVEVPPRHTPAHKVKGKKPQQLYRTLTNATSCL